MSAKQHLNFHGTVSTFVCQFHLSLTGAPVLQCNCNLSLCAWHSSCWKAKPLFVSSSLQPDSTVTQSTSYCSLEDTSKSLCHLMSCSTPRTVVSTTRERGINADKKGVDLDVCLRGRRQAVSGFVSTVSPARRAAFTASALLASLPFFFVMHDCCRAVLNSCDTASCRKVSLFSSVVCVSSRSNRVEFLHLCNSETCQCAKHCALDFGDFGVLHCVHHCVLDTSRVALRLGRCVLLTEWCDQTCHSPPSHEHLVVVTDWCRGAASSDCSIEGVLLLVIPPMTHFRVVACSAAVRLTVSASALQQP